MSAKPELLKARADSRSLPKGPGHPEWLHTFFAKHLCHEALLPGCDTPQIFLHHALGRPQLLLWTDIHPCGNCNDTCYFSIISTIRWCMPGFTTEPLNR